MPSIEITDLTQGPPKEVVKALAHAEIPPAAVAELYGFYLHIFGERPSRGEEMASIADEEPFSRDNAAGKKRAIVEYHANHAVTFLLLFIDVFRYSKEARLAVFQQVCAQHWAHLYALHKNLLEYPADKLQEIMASFPEQLRYLEDVLHCAEYFLKEADMDRLRLEFAGVQGVYGQAEIIIRHRLVILREEPEITAIIAHARGEARRTIQDFLTAQSGNDARDIWN